MKQDPYPPLEPGKYYHVYNRGNNKETIFKEPRNYYYFLSLWIKHIDPVAKTFCYNLLPNHFHFFIWVEEANNDSQKTSQAFSNFFNAFAKAINRKYNRTGSLSRKGFEEKKLQVMLILQRSLVIYLLMQQNTDTAKMRQLILTQPTKV